MLLGFEAMHLPPNVALFALEDNQSSAKALHHVEDEGQKRWTRRLSRFHAPDMTEL
jgi:hypothetical protein